MPQLCEPDNLPPAPFQSSTGVFENTTIRQTLKVTLSAETIRIRISNAFGINVLRVSALTIGTPAPHATSAGSSRVRADSLHEVSFGGKAGIAVPNGALAISDPIPLSVNAGESVSVSLYLEFGQEGNQITSHPGSRTTSWCCFDNKTYSSDLRDAIPVDHWYFLSAIEGLISDDHCAFVLIGDSITDGRGSTTNGNDRWPDLVSRKMQEDPFARHISVINQAAGGNRILLDGLGPNAWGRITRDVLGHSAVKYALIFEGVNDIGCTLDTEEDQDLVYHHLIAAYQQMILQMRTHGILVFGGTIAPFCAPEDTDVQPYSSLLRDKTRRRVNEWIMSSGEYDYVVDFAKALEDPHCPERLLPEYDCGDFLHPSPAGYRRMAEVFDVTGFESLQDL